MILISMIFVCICLFLLGFFLGISNEPQIKTYKVKSTEDEDLIKLKKEYQNFLNYDGSGQE